MEKIEKCAICRKRIKVICEKFEDERVETEYSNEGISLPVDNYTYKWFCNDCHKELTKNIKINAVDILHELENES